ncbi:MAG TPA: class I SAM-dependent methyltransferase [bacterium]
MTSYVPVTEVPGSGATAEQLEMLATRYRFAADLTAGRDVLEVACGPGIGLGYLARGARRVVGGDVDERLLHAAKRHYGPRIGLLRLDAHILPFADRSFDAVILFEALYYLREPVRFLGEARRVLRPAGMLLISMVNREWRGFNPSPYSTRYFSAGELRALLESSGFAVELRGGFPSGASTLGGKVLGYAREGAVRLRLIPSTMRGKQVLKRLVYGPLTALPAELMNGRGSSLVPLRGDLSIPEFKVLYALGRN